MICRVSPLPPTFKVGSDDIGNEYDNDGDDDDNDVGGNEDDNVDDDDNITSSPSFLHSLVKEDASAG